MVRPRKLRRIFFQPNITYFRPTGIPITNLENVILSFEELEAIRLVDLEGIEQIKASEKMKISQPTLSRLLKEARKKLADAIVNGYSIKIQGGNFKMDFPGRGLGRGMGRGAGRGFGQGAGMGRGRQGGFGAGPDGECVCPNCGYSEPHEPGVPCYEKQCPKCGAQMTRR